MRPADSDEPGRAGAESDDDKRRSLRRRVLKDAKIVYNGGHSVLDARLQDISETGARIQLPSPVVLPEDFDLHLSDGRKLRVEIVWRNAAMLGVRFAHCPRDRAQPGSRREESALLDRILDIEQQLAELRREVVARLRE